MARYRGVHDDGDDVDNTRTWTVQGCISVVIDSGKSWLPL